MSYVQFESAHEKEKIRQELRDAREQLLEKAKQSAKQRSKREAQKVLSGEANWMLPSVSAKIDKMSAVSSKLKKRKDKKKKSKQSKKATKKKKKLNSNDSQSDIDSPDEKSHKSSKQRLKKKRSRKQTESSDSVTDSESSEYRKLKLTKRKKRTSSNSDSESSNKADKWIEKPSTTETAVQRDNWMTDALLFKTYSREKSDKKPNENQIDAYDPAKSARELNPYWKLSGTGMPSTFQKPRDESDDDTTHRSKHTSRQTSNVTKNWQKKINESPKQKAGSKVNTQRSKSTQAASTSFETSSDDEECLDYAHKPQSAVEQKASVTTTGFLTDQQMNELAAKIIKAEILGNNEIVLQLKEKLENARECREQIKDRKQEKNSQANAKKNNNIDELILLTHTDNKGNSRPLQQSQSINPNDLYGGRSGKRKAKQQRVETHIGGERIRYFADDDKYDIKQMFEREKYTSAADSNLQFANIASKNKNPNDDLEDIFADKIRSNISKEGTDQKELSRAIHEQKKFSAKLDNCNKCFDSNKMDKKLIVSLGDKVYLALPWHIGLQWGHCMLIPTQHVSCCTQLDEDTWEEINNFRKALTKMYASQKKDVIFFEIANKLDCHPHLSIHCVPIRNKDAEMAPFYFKKAIEESEHEWSVNKQLVVLRSKGLRSSIPKGLPYFWVNFGMDSGFAHVIEDQSHFPPNFAQEIIGGLLHLDPSKWRRPQKEQNIIAKVKMFADGWKQYDCTN